MDNTTTRNFLADEEEVNHWLSVFELIPDRLYSDSKQQPSVFIVNSLKAFSRAYQPFFILGREDGMVIN